MNNVSPPSQEFGMAWLEKLAKQAEEGAPGVTPIPPSSIADGGGSAGVTPKDDRARAQFRFWLDVMKDPEFELAQEIMLLKKRKKFAATIRDGLRLIIDLRAGRIDVLLQLFPWVKDAVMKEVMR
jgi:hypothetical protein